jgi:hypothetical protein
MDYKQENGHFSSMPQPEGIALLRLAQGLQSMVQSMGMALT